MKENPGSRETLLLEEGKEIVETHNITHIAVIVDGNRRWAQEHGLPPIEGHRQALKVLLERVEDCAAIGLSYVTAWLFSTENWQRPPEQVLAIFNLGREMEDEARRVFDKVGARFLTIGRKDRIPADLQEILQAIEDETSGNSALVVIAAIDYGGRDEIIRAVNRGIQTKVSAFTPESLQQFLDTADLPHPDLVVRTSGERRTSGFMPWQTVYSEWIFRNEHFPNFGRGELVECLREFAGRQRRFGR